MKKVLLWGGLCVFALLTGWYVQQRTQFDAQTLAGEKISWNNSQGRWHVVNFFAPWCAPCLREIPALNRMKQTLPSHIHLVGVSYDGGKRDTLVGLVDTLGVAFDVIDTSQAAHLPMPFPDYLPATYIISPEGNVNQALYGEQNEVILQETLRKMGLLNGE